MLELILDVQRHARLVARLRDHGFEGRGFATGEENVGLIGERPPGNSFVVFELVPARERNGQLL